MRTATSKDGTHIAYWRNGEGPALLLVHGGTADHTTTWQSVLSGLEQHFTVYTIDRRGRGSSGDTQPYELAREAEDVAAVVDAIGEPVSVLGHSYGGLCALESALCTVNIRHLILYESVPLSGSDLYQPNMTDQLEALLAAGDVEGMLITTFRELVEMPEAEIELLRSKTVMWATRLSNAPTLPREVKSEQRYIFEPSRFKGMLTPTLFLVGGDSPARELANAQGIASALPDARVVVMPGQGHAAMHTAPDLFITEVVRFLQ